MFRLSIALTSCLSLFLLAGCDEPPAPASSVRKASSAPPPPPPGATDPEGASVEEHTVDIKSDEPEFEREVAKTGVGKKGRNYGGGIISEPIRQRFRVEQQINFQNVKRAMDLYRAEHGYFPKTEEEFMSKIIKANSIALPELPDGERYVYEPKTGELMVERPKSR